MAPIIPVQRSHPFNDPDWLFEPKYDGFRGGDYDVAGPACHGPGADLRHPGRVDVRLRLLAQAKRPQALKQLVRLCAQRLRLHVNDGIRSATSVAKSW